MVLQSKWDKRASRDRARKFKAKGKELPEVARAKQQAAAAAKLDKGIPSRRRDDGTVISAVGEEDDEEDDDEEETDSDESLDGILLGTNPADLPKPKPKQPTADAKEKKDEEDTEEEEDAPRGQFSRRKLASNAWRYETTEPADLDLPFTHNTSTEPPPPAEPEPDYVALTLSRPSVVEREPPKPAVELDYEFLNAAKKGKEDEKKSTVVKVKKEQFKEVEEKIAKKSAVDAFKARFVNSQKGVRKPKTVTSTTQHCGGDDEVLEDVDAFLGELELEDKPKNPPTSVGRPAVVSPKPVRKVDTGDLDDEWLDSMLGR